MPITIKELFPSDPLSEALEKVNFNFDQLILAGGGPPGPIGPLGPQGVPGPLGPRGDHWFVGASALGATADHDGGQLKVQDHFLDSLGDVYSYFENIGGTGWTYSGINLMGPMGPTGITGGSDDVQIQAGGSGNAITPTSGGYGPQASNVPTALVDFWMPRNMAKNSIFVGDANWATTLLQNFGSNSSAITDQNSVPQFTVIQKNTNQSGLNGFMIGAMGGGYGTTNNANPEGGIGATTSAFDFVHFAFAKPINGGSYDRMFRIKSFKQKFRIEVGGNTLNEVSSPFEIASNSFSWNNNADGQFTNPSTRQAIFTYHLQTYTGLVGSGIEMYTRPDWSNSYATQKYGIIGFQNVQGSSPNFGNFNTAHGFGNVHIGATSDGTTPIGTRMQQALGISRPISFGVGNNDASIRFFGNDFLQVGNEWSAIAGGIRHFNQLAVNSLGSNTIRSIQFGSGYSVTGDITPSTQSRQVGGRIGINNHPGWNDFNTARSINMPVHINLTGFNGIDRAESPFPSQPVIPNIGQWAFGIDYDKVSGESGPFHAGWDTDSSGLGVAYSAGHSGATGNLSTRSIILQSYYVGSANVNTFSGRRNPHFYSQIGSESTFGNFGLGFVPTPSQPKTEAWSKLSINGSVTIGNIAFGYHDQDAIRSNNGLLIEGAIYQGSTGSTGLFSTILYGPTAVFNGTNGAIRISSIGLITGDRFIARTRIIGATVSRIPAYSFPDLRTGIDYRSGATGKGFFTIPGPEILGGQGIDSVNGPTAPIRDVGYWSSYSGEGTQAVEWAPALVASRRMVQAPSYSGSGAGGRSYTLQDLVNNGYATFHTFQNPAGGGPLTRKQIWLVIPSTESTAVLDFSTGATFGWWANQSGQPWVPADTTSYFLNGNPTTVGPSPRSGFLGQVGLTIQPGNYDGQKLTVIIKDVHPNNAFQSSNVGELFNKQNNYVRFKAERAINTFPLSSSAAPSPTFINTNFSDVLVMARDYYPRTVTGANNPSFFNLDVQKLPYPVPNATEAFSTSPLLGTTANIYSNIYNPNQSDGRGWHSDQQSLPDGSGGTLLIVGGWRVINFMWLNDYTTNPAANIGCWVETGREYLANRGQKNNSGVAQAVPPVEIPPIDNPIDPFPPLDPDPNPFDPFPGGGGGGGGGGCCFLPGTLISMSNGSKKEIENIEIGDSVISYNEVTGELLTNEVIKISSPERDSIYECILENGDSVKITPDHPVYVEDKGWSAINVDQAERVYQIHIEQLEIGDVLIGDVENLKILEIQKIEGLISKTHTFTVKDDNYPSYFANGILAHNNLFNDLSVCQVIQEVAY